MKTWIVLVVLLVGIVLMVRVAAAVELPSYDGFETYDAGTYPSPPWSEYISGINAVVSTEQAYSGSNKSFKLSGVSGWSRADVLQIDFPDAFTYSTAVMIAAGPKGGSMGLAKTWGGASPINGPVLSANLNYISWEGPGQGNILLDKCFPDKWYAVLVAMDGFHGASPTADVTITYDGGHATHIDLAAYSAAEANEDLLQLHTFSGWASTVYFDDVEVSVAPRLPGDADGNSVVDDLDLTALAAHWEQYGGWADGDFSRDGFISDRDLTILALAWPAGGLDISAVPEPATLSLLALGGLALLRRKHRRPVDTQSR